MCTPQENHVEFASSVRHVRAPKGVTIDRSVMAGWVDYMAALLERADRAHPTSCPRRLRRSRGRYHNFRARSGARPNNDRLAMDGGARGEILLIHRAAGCAGHKFANPSKKSVLPQGIPLRQTGRRIRWGPSVSRRKL
jgi:hypothetical protein